MKSSLASQGFCDSEIGEFCASEDSFALARTKLERDDVSLPFALFCFVSKTALASGPGDLVYELSPSRKRKTQNRSSRGKVQKTAHPSFPKGEDS